ncbi:hypothetical protein NST99_32180 [Paenibacillus sp. FSL L8-0470]
MLTRKVMRLLLATHQKQVWDGTSWTDTAITDTRTVDITVSLAPAASATITRLR